MMGSLLGLSLPVSIAFVYDSIKSPVATPREKVGVVSSRAALRVSNARLSSSNATRSNDKTTDALSQVIAAVVRVSSRSTGGSGVVIDPSGMVLTSAHIIGDDPKVRVVAEDGRSLVGSLIRVDKERDLALLLLPTGTYPSAKLGTNADVILGAPATVIGYPINMTGPATVATGVVSRLLDDTKSKRKVIQTDAAINMGNSGGPIVDSQGSVIGIITSVVGEYKEIPIRGIGFAVSINTIRDEFLRLAPGRDSQLLIPNPPKDTDGRREDSGRVGEGATGEMAGLHWGRLEVGGRSSVAA